MKQECADGEPVQCNGLREEGWVRVKDVPVQCLQ